MSLTAMVCTPPFLLGERKGRTSNKFSKRLRGGGGLGLAESQFVEGVGGKDWGDLFQGGLQFLYNK